MNSKQCDLHAALSLYEKGLHNLIRKNNHTTASIDVRENMTAHSDLSFAYVRRKYM